MQLNVIHLFIFLLLLLVILRSFYIFHLFKKMVISIFSVSELWSSSNISLLEDNSIRLRESTQIGLNILQDRNY